VSEAYEQNRFCLDSDCGGVAEPEEELTDGGVLRYFACSKCEMEFGYEVIPDGAAAGSCSLGIPEGVRRAASLPPDDSKVFLGATIGRRPQ
jgi:hypothetical protein